MVRFSASSRSASFSSSTPRPSGSRPVPSCRRRRAARDRSQTGHLTIVPLKLPGAQSIPPIHNAGRTRVATLTGRVVRSAGWRRAGMRSTHDSEHRIGVGYPFVLSQWCLLVDRKVRTRPRSYPQVAPQYGCTIWWRYLFEPHMFDAPTSEKSPPVDRAHVTDPVGIFSQHRDQIPLAAVISHHYRQGDETASPSTSHLQGHVAATRHTPCSVLPRPKPIEQSCYHSWPFTAVEPSIDPVEPVVIHGKESDTAWRRNFALRAGWGLVWVPAVTRSLPGSVKWDV